MRLGFIVECVLDGPDSQVCRDLAKRMRGDLSDDDIKIRTMGDKRTLKRECGAAAKALMDDSQCDRVIIVWDLRPVWKEDGDPCRQEDRQQVLQSLTDAGADITKTRLVCVEAMLETWLLTDGRAIASIITETTRRQCRRVHIDSDFQHFPDPKDHLDRMFRRHNSSYVDRVHAVKIVRAWPNFDRARILDAFRRFEGFVAS